MGKLEISKELSDKISNSLRIKKTDIVDGSANKPIIRKLESPKKDSPQRQLTPKYSPIKKDSPQRQQSSKNSPIKKRYEFLRPPAQRDSSPKNIPISNPKIIHRLNTSNKLDYMKISKIVFISSIVGGIGITLGIKLGTILFL